MDAEGGRTSYGYDEQNRIISMTDARGNVTGYTYDGACITSMTDAAGNLWSYTYDGMNRMLTQMDPLGRVSGRTYDPKGRVTAETDAMGGSILYTLDPAGAVTAIRDREEQTTLFTYDKMNRMLTAQDPLGNTMTFTYDNAKHTEESFRQSLRNTLKHLVSRKGWKYIGVWERSASERLHFHGIFYIPEHAMIGELKQVSDYSTKRHRMQTTYQNTHFSRRFGRNDFKAIDKNEVVQSVRYLLKYIEKSGERLVFGGDLPTYFKSDITDEDIVCPTGVDGKKMLMYDDFNCWEDGYLVGKVCAETISQLPKCN